jgi:endo-1,3(4)-beta-glucanase
MIEYEAHYICSDNLGRTDLILPVIDYLEASFAQWFNTSATTMAAYETAWGGVINKAGANNSWVDFGNGYYNDHHFHYGYFLAVAAVIAKYDQSWLNQHRDFINWFARYVFLYTVLMNYEVNDWLCAGTS